MAYRCTINEKIIFPNSPSLSSATKGYLLCIYQSNCKCFSYRSNCFFLCSSVCKNTSFHQLSVRCILCIGQYTSGNGSRNSSTAYQHEPSGNHFHSCIIHFAGCYRNDRTCMGTASCRCIVYSNCGYIVRKDYALLHSLIPLPLQLPIKKVQGALMSLMFFSFLFLFQFKQSLFFFKLK